MNDAMFRVACGVPVMKRILSACMVCSLVFSANVLAMQALEDEQLADVDGAGLAIALDAFRYRMAPTSYIELIGQAVDPAAAAFGWKRGDLRYFGLSLSAAGAGATDWFGDGVDIGGTGAGGIHPIGGLVTNFASVYNPYVLRVAQYQGYSFTNTTSAWLAPGAGAMPTVLELIGPSKTDAMRWSFWGELEVAKGATCPTGGNAAICGLQSQTIIEGKPVTLDGKPAVIRFMQTSFSNASMANTFGITYQSALSGDFRFSVGALAGSALGKVPNFDNREGLFFRNVDAFLPLGVLHSQAITFDAVNKGQSGEGNFVIELTPIPNIPQIYNNIYCGTTGVSGGATPSACTTSQIGNASVGLVKVVNPNPATHGYVRWGTTSSCTATGDCRLSDLDGNSQYNSAPLNAPANWVNCLAADINVRPGCSGYGTLNNGNAATNGIFFRSPSAAPDVTTNIGSARIDGVLIQSMKVTTLGI